MVAEGLYLLAVGMGAVFAFLSLLVVSMHASARVFAAFPKWFPDDAPADYGLERRVVEDRADVALAVALAHAMAAREGGVVDGR